MVNMRYFLVEISCLCRYRGHWGMVKISGKYIRIQFFSGGNISRQTKIFVYSKNRIFSEKSGFSENFMPENFRSADYRK